MILYMYLFVLVLFLIVGVFSVFYAKNHLKKQQ